MNQTTNSTQELINMLFTNYTPDTLTQDLKPSDFVISLLPAAYEKNEAYGLGMAFQLLSNVKLDSEFIIRHAQEGLDLALLTSTTLMESEVKNEKDFAFVISHDAQMAIVERMLHDDVHTIQHHGDKGFLNVLDFLTALTGRYNLQKYTNELGSTYESQKDYYVSKLVESTLMAVHGAVVIEESRAELNPNKEEAEAQLGAVQDAAFTTINRYLRFMSNETLNHMIESGLAYPIQAIMQNPEYTAEQFIEHAHDYLELAELTSFASDLALNADKGTPEQLMVLDLTLDIISAMHDQQRFSDSVEEVEHRETVDEETFEDLNK